MFFDAHIGIFWGNLGDVIASRWTARFILRKTLDFLPNGRIRLVLASLMETWHVNDAVRGGRLWRMQCTARTAASACRSIRVVHALLSLLSIHLSASAAAVSSPTPLVPAKELTNSTLVAHLPTEPRSGQTVTRPDARSVHADGPYRAAATA